MIDRPRRSVLYVPGSNARALAKSRLLDVDAVIIDLEDAVSPDDKRAARAAAVEAVAAGGFGHREVVIRVNGPDTPWGADDMAAAAAAGPDGVLVPKVAGPEALRGATASLADAPGPLRVWAMIETPLAVLRLADIAGTAADPGSRLAVLVLGTNDLAKDLRVATRPGREPLLAWVAATVAAARAYRLDALDGVFNVIDDPAGLAAEARQGRDFGFDGKTCIHPGQIAVCNSIFAPGPGELAWARRVVDAFGAPEGTGRNVLRIDGRMVERLHADEARRLLAVAAVLAERDGAPSAPRGGPSPAL